MNIALLGGSGKLGSLVCQVLRSENTPFTCLTKESISSLKQLQTFLKAQQNDFVLLDVSLAQASFELCTLLAQCGSFETQKIRGLVVGTTGHSAECQKSFCILSSQMPLFVISNFSKGLFLFKEILAACTSTGLTVAQLAKKLGFDLGIQEIHHKKKKDVPSGTSLALAKEAQIEIENIGSLRLGAVVGEHTLYASGVFEQLEITHIAHNRMLFALGAVELCRNIFLTKPCAGLFDKAWSI